MWMIPTTTRVLPQVQALGTIVAIEAAGAPWGHFPFAEDQRQTAVRML